MSKLTRRSFLQRSAAAGLAAECAQIAFSPFGIAAEPPGTGIRFGLVTYQWGRDLDLPALLKHCETSGLLGVELRTTHAHKVEPALSPEQRQEVKKRFADSPVKLVGLGSAEEFHSPDPKVLERAIESTKAFIKLSHDVGGTGVKVRPNALPKEVPPEKTIEQIGKALNVVAAFGADYGQQLRMEVHGGCAPGCGHSPERYRLLEFEQFRPGTARAGTQFQPGQKPTRFSHARPGVGHARLRLANVGEAVCAGGLQRLVASGSGQQPAGRSCGGVGSTARIVRTVDGGSRGLVSAHSDPLESEFAADTLERVDHPLDVLIQRHT